MFNIKELFVLTGLLFIIGVLGILYRAVIDRPIDVSQTGQVMCSQDTRTCANGLVEKRIEPDCTFVVCPQAVSVLSTTTPASTMANETATDTNPVNLKNKMSTSTTSLPY